MTTLESIFADEFGDLCEIAESRGWHVEEIDGPAFRLVLPAKGGELFHLEVECGRYPIMPPAFQWRCPITGKLGQPECTPYGGGFLHQNGVICAPWNRHAYKEVNPGGLHGDWALATWKTNSHTGQATTLCAMALRIAHELMSENYKGKAA